MSKSSKKRLAKETRTGYKVARPGSDRRNRFQRIISNLRACDPGIIEIVQFGSSVYAPRLARDVDLMVTTRDKKDEALYWDAVADWNKNVDLLIREPEQSMGRDIALSVYVYGRSLYGNGRTRKEAMQFMPVPIYEDARKLLIAADKDIERAHQETDPFYRDRDYRIAFNTLFDAVRYAAMTFLNTDETRWGKLPKQLPKQFETRFRAFISKLHVQFSYEGNYPKEQADEVFKEWHGKVSAFIDELAARSSSND